MKFLNHLVFFLLAVAVGLALRPTSTATTTTTAATKLKMGFLDGLFGPKKAASASHILVPGKDGSKVLMELKTKISKSKDMKKAFADAASQYSTCPSGKRGGSLGTFKQGQMVPAFDKVVFNEAIGVVHGPVATPFGNHLILIESREG